MNLIAALTIEEELRDVRANAAARGWVLSQTDELHFILGFPASDNTFLYVYAECDDYPVKPPAWHWCDKDGTGHKDMRNVPKGTGFLHSNGVICAPWSRLAYTPVDSRGPHNDWTISDWRNNPYTKGCKTLGGMALRIAVELRSDRYHKQRMAG
jgi:hypothetical protein